MKIFSIKNKKVSFMKKVQPVSKWEKEKKPTILDEMARLIGLKKSKRDNTYVKKVV
jgi:hypothetical protein